jgi:hypothetical protein
MDLDCWGFNQAVHGGGVGEVGGVFPVVVSTWPFREAVRAAWDVVSAGDGGGSAVDAVVAGCSACEVLRCDGTGQALARVILLLQMERDHNRSSRGREAYVEIVVLLSKAYLIHKQQTGRRITQLQTSGITLENRIVKTQMFKHTNCLPFALYFFNLYFYAGIATCTSVFCTSVLYCFLYQLQVIVSPLPLR